VSRFARGRGVKGSSQKYLQKLPQIHRLNLFIICESVATFCYELPSYSYL